MKPEQSRVTETIQAGLGICLVPALWPLSFIGVAIYLPGVIDPLLGGLQNVLYYPALLWLIFILASTAGIARLFRLKRTNILLLGTATGCALAVSAVFCGWTAWETFQLIGQKGVIYPDHFDVGYELVKFVKLAAFITVLTWLTIGVLILVGGFRLWKTRPKP